MGRGLLGRLYLFTAYSLRCYIAFRNLCNYLGVFLLTDVRRFSPIHPGQIFTLQFVIVPAFYLILLILSNKLSIHCHHRVVADARAYIIALNNAQQVCVTVADDSSAYLGICISNDLAFTDFARLLPAYRYAARPNMPTSCGKVHQIFLMEHSP